MTTKKVLLTTGAALMALATLVGAAIASSGEKDCGKACPRSCDRCPECPICRCL